MVTRQVYYASSRAAGRVAAWGDGLPIMYGRGGEGEQCQATKVSPRRPRQPGDGREPAKGRGSGAVLQRGARDRQSGRRFSRRAARRDDLRLRQQFQRTTRPLRRAAPARWFAAKPIRARVTWSGACSTTSRRTFTCWSTAMRPMTHEVVRRAEHLEHRPSTSEIGRRTADQQRQRSSGRAARAAGDRRVQVSRSERLQALCGEACSFGCDAAHVDDEVVCREHPQTRRCEQRRVQCRGVLECGDDDRCRGQRGGCARGNGGAGGRERQGLFRRSIPHRDAKAGADQSRGVVAPHVAEADDCNGRFIVHLHEVLGMQSRSGVAIVSR